VGTSVTMVLDSNIVIDYLDGDTTVVSLVDSLRERGIPFVISSITKCEVLSARFLSSSELTKIKRFLNENVAVFAFDSDLAEDAAELRRECLLKTPDAAIAATALTLKVPLLTRDKHFRKIPELTVVEV